uniref:Uncharacterized protein n=1 Tax=Tanacetum cinerariifolium TaxID=118510 RepID=A0A6L2LEH4_TANCI|nr:hypothetical protein [Tanacetum cinerariifolium]
MSQDIMICVMNSTAVLDDVHLEMKSSESCVKCLNLDAELLNKQNAYNDPSKSYLQLETHCISLELTMQLNQEILQKDSLSNNQNALEILEYYKNNDLKAQQQAKDTTIYLKGQIQEKVFVTTALQSELSIIKGKHVMDNATTISLGIFKLDLEPLSHRLKNNRDAYDDYLKKTMENTDTIGGLVKRARK